MNISKNIDINQLVSKYKLVIKSELDYEFRDDKVLFISIIHRSIKNEYKDVFGTDNEKLEFLGDSVLDLIVSNFLFFLPEYGDDEGRLTVSRSKIVKQKTLASFARILKIDQFLITAKTGQEVDIAANESVLSDAFEALVGAIFLDSGYKATEKAILHRFEGEFYKILNSKNQNYKSSLSEYLDKHTNKTARYKLVEAKGPDHDKTFESVVLIGNREYGSGIGKSKKEAEAKAAKVALEKIQNEN